jgi:spore maturation protein CgeB
MSEDFLYFEDEEDLKKILNHVVNNYDEFDQMRENAYNKAVNNYTTKHFVEKFLK